MPSLIQTLSPVLLVALIAGILKGFLPAALPNRDNVIRGMAMLLGVGQGAGDYFFNATHVTGTGLEHAMGNGLLVGVGAILSYHLITGDVWDGITGAATTLTPPTLMLGSAGALPPTPPKPAPLPPPAGALPPSLLGTTGTQLPVTGGAGVDTAAFIPTVREGK